MPTPIHLPNYPQLPDSTGSKVFRCVGGLLALFLAGNGAKPAHGCPALPGDLDGNGAVVAADLQLLADCLGGPDVMPAGCRGADLDGDGDVDLLDFSVLQQNATAPVCTGLRVPYLNISYDGGLTYVPHIGPPPTQYFNTWSIAAGNANGLMYMHAQNALWASLDDGCSWTMLPPAVTGLFRLSVGPGGIAYAWPDNGNGTGIYRITPQSGGTFVVAQVNTPQTLLGLAVDPLNSAHVRACSDVGQLYDSVNGGATWNAIGVPGATGTLILGYFAAFDPGNLNHVVYGQASSGGAVTFDAGRNWTRCGGLAPENRANFFKAVFSPLDPTIVYGMGINLVENLAGAPSEGRHIYVSTDGGLSFAPVLDAHSEGVELQNGPVMVADPRDANILHFLMSTRPQFGGTTFYTYDRISDLVSYFNVGTIPTVRSMEFAPRHPCEMLIGFEFIP